MRFKLSNERDSEEEKKGKEYLKAKKKPLPKYPVFQ
jgi:hypothetical protein